jgi:hypothetical protein
MKKPLGALILLLACAASARADVLTVGSDCLFSLPNGGTQAFAFSLLWDTGSAAIVPDSITHSFSGSLGTFELAAFGTRTAPVTGTVFPFVNWEDDSENLIQLALFDYLGAGFPRTGDYSLANMQLWCGADQCGLSNYTTGASSGWLRVGIAEEPARVPEPPSWMLLLTALAVITAVFGLRKRPTPSEQH